MVCVSLLCHVLVWIGRIRGSAQPRRWSWLLFPPCSNPEKGAGYKFKTSGSGHVRRRTIPGNYGKTDELRGEKWYRVLRLASFPRLLGVTRRHMGHSKRLNPGFSASSLDGNPFIDWGAHISAFIRKAGELSKVASRSVMF
ncbi:hypothetical protein BJX61DRAFT_209452 [Aspergillus egyptiacus]|nr:hypothetical protein BJX61DRAFT_209452 [Aspergillus egyptiacus]